MVVPSAVRMGEVRADRRAEGPSYRAEDPLEVPVGKVADRKAVVPSCQVAVPLGGQTEVDPWEDQRAEDPLEVREDRKVGVPSCRGVVPLGGRTEAGPWEDQRAADPSEGRAVRMAEVPVGKEEASYQAGVVRKAVVRGARTVGVPWGDPSEAFQAEASCREVAPWVGRRAEAPWEDRMEAVP